MSVHHGLADDRKEKMPLERMHETDRGVTWAQLVISKRYFNSVP
jgi:hypothetical protein